MHKVRLVFSVFLAAIALLSAAASVGAQEQTTPPIQTGYFISGSIPKDGGFGLVLFSGGTYSQLVAAAECPGSNVVYWGSAQGRLVVYIPSSPIAAPSADFAAAFPGGQVPPRTVLIGRCILNSTQGIQGSVTLGPICPVERPFAPCPDRPYVATIVILDAQANEVKRVTSGSDGRFEVILAPGGYTLVPLVPSSGFTSAQPQQVTVRTGVYEQVRIIYDTGIRSLDPTPMPLPPVAEPAQ